MLKRFVNIFGGDPTKREIEQHAEIVEQINALEPVYETLSDEDLGAKTVEFRNRLDQGETLEDILVETFAVVREASKRAIGLRHYDIQMVGGVVLHLGKIAEMRTGEGKTLVATLPLYLNGLTGKGVHLITVNDYLARRDARWMAPIYNLLGLSVGVLQMAARTESGKKAYLVDLERESPHEDQHQLIMVSRAQAYAADITYGTNSEFGFDYLRDNMTMSLDERVQRSHHFAIIDEVDNVLIDEARTPLIISGPAQDEAEWYIRMAQVVRQLRPEDYEIDEKGRSISLTEIGEAHVEQILDMPLRDPDRPEDLTLEQMRLLGYLEQGMRAQYVYKRNKDYLVQAGKVVIVDEFTGRMMPGRRWSDGLHQAVEAKEGVRVQSESVTYATITIQNYFRMYEKLSGMTGTAVTESEEFHKIYELDVLAIPTNLEYQASLEDSGLIELDERDQDGYKYTYYAREDDPEKTQVFWKRKDYPDVVYRTQEAKLRALAREILSNHVLGRPLLVGTTSVELSETVSGRLRTEPLRRLCQVLLLRDTWMSVHGYVEDGRAIDELQFLYVPIDKLDTGNMRKLARELEISFNPEEGKNLVRLIELLGLAPMHGERLEASLKGGIPHEVLNARKHTEESQIIAGAGAFGAVTIATNMAGRGVDIKLGGDLAEEIISSANRVLRRAGIEDPYNMTMEERRRVFLEIPKEDYGIYGPEIDYFLNHMDEMEMVRALGGLHVIGSERHEARRIDNQLRGRAARQGDPGSSRFYLSMEDELMRLFGGQQAQNLMERMKIDDALPLEVGLVGRLVEQSQTRVEGANFDVRKHLLEYDDVLNTQRASIYSQRNRIFSKDDLTEDVTGMLRSEVTKRVPDALEDEGDAWKLLAWLDQIQPTLDFGPVVFPSYSMRLILDDLLDSLDLPTNRNTLRDALLNAARGALDAEKRHNLDTVGSLLASAEIRLEDQLVERIEMVDTFFEALSFEEEADLPKPGGILEELSVTIQVPIRLSSENQRMITEDPYEVIDDVRQQVEEALRGQAITRLVGAIERRLGDSLSVDPKQLVIEGWFSMANLVMTAAEELLERRIERLVGESGSITNDLDNTLARLGDPIGEQGVLRLLLMMPQGSRATFDKKTHRRVFQRTTRLTYIYYAAQYLNQREPVDVGDEVLEHLELAQESLQRAWGLAELNRLGNSSLAGLEAEARNGILDALGEEESALAIDQSLNELSDNRKKLIADELGRRALTAVYRQLLLGVITELWVDYLTQMEALRVSVGLEAYGQRDPLVQYKNRAFDLYQELLSNMRLGVVTRMFTYRPRDLDKVQAATSRVEIPVSPPEIASEGEKPVFESQSSEQDQQANLENDGNDNKKRRRRRRRR